MAVRVCFDLGTARVKSLGRLKKERRKKNRKMTNADFHHFQVLHFSNVLEQSLCYCTVGATPESRF